MTDTIFALASGATRAGVAVVRVSGPGAAAAIQSLSGDSPPEPRRAAFRTLRAANGTRIDRGYVLWFPAPRSFTGEDVAEFQVHGGPAVVAGLLSALGAGPGARLAEPGEFSRRAFENGKMDLTAVEGLADLIDAETEAQRRQALRQMDGGLGELYDGWADRLLRILAHVEAAIDFPEEYLPEGLDAAALATVDHLVADIDTHLAEGHRGERLRDGIQLAILGAPNAGKSSILNRLVRREAAIVSPIAGTTRDVIEAHLDVGGYPVLVADTAGLRAGADAIEREGVNRARRRAADADLHLAVLDATQWPDIDPETGRLIDARTLVVLNKSDLADLPSSPLVVGEHEVVVVSAKSGDGMADLVARLTELIAARWAPAATPGLTRQRHREALEACRKALTRARSGHMAELVAEDIRLATRALGRITGRVGVEAILDVIFKEFCIGK